MTAAPAYLKLAKRTTPSPSARVRASLNYPVIDTDLHTIEFGPILEDYIDKVGGAKIVDLFRQSVNRGLGSLGNEWYALTPQQRLDIRAPRPPWWALPAKNTLDLATFSLPKLLAERLEDGGSDFGVVYPNLTLFAIHVGHEELRRAVVRAINLYHADLFRPYADRLTPVAAIPLHTPQEGIEELEFAVRELGLKVAIIPGNLRRPIKALADKYPAADHPEIARHLTWLDTFGIDSAHDYDPFWAKAVELKVPLTTHSIGMGWTSRSSVNNYMYNHIGHFASASEALAKSLFLSGVTKRFPQLRFGLIEGGAAWASNLYADLVGHWEKRSGQAVQNYNPDRIDGDLLYQLYQAYAEDNVRARLGSKEDVVAGAYGVSTGRRLPQNPDELDDFRAVGIERIEDIRDHFIPNFYIGTEADDPVVAHALNAKVNPLGARINAFWASDAGHWDVADYSQALSDTWNLVERGTLTLRDFRDLVFTNPYNLYTSANPDFFKGTQVEQRLPQSLAVAAE